MVGGITKRSNRRRLISDSTATDAGEPSPYLLVRAFAADATMGARGSRQLGCHEQRHCAFPDG
jgi:hypothetical protein